MVVDFDSLFQFITSILMFPANFQSAFLHFAWGANDPTWLMVLKRGGLLLPVAAFIFNTWATMGCAATLPFRSNRSEFMPALLVTWWDFGRAVTQFWGGAFKFTYALLGSILGLFRLMVLSLLLLFQDLLLAPLRVAKEVGEGYFRPGVPWIAVCITLAWCVLEAGVFTFVTSPLVTDVLSAIHDGNISETTMHSVLYCMMFAFVLGSYSILSTWGQAFKDRNISKIVQIGTFEAFVMVFEVLFLYREFVDALVPWFNQYTSGESTIGLIPILAISTFAWLGIRGMTWFLFAGAGTPTILAIIQRSGIPGVGGSSSQSKSASLQYIRSAMGSVRSEMDWVQEKGEELLAAFILPPLQIVASVVNFCTLLITGRHMFQLPFKEIKDLQLQKPVVEQIPVERKRAA